MNRYILRKTALYLSSFLLACFVLVSPNVDAQNEPVAPNTETEKRLGVASCASSHCHGATKPYQNVSILQNEYLIWQRKDRHSRAYETLLSEEAAAIIRNLPKRLGIVSAKDAPSCLVCHTDYVPASARGERYQIEDGVGCEACHGSASGWLEQHINPKTTHQDNLRAGLVALEEPSIRAQQCLGCHFGDDKHPMSHLLMGAGHPPLGFELDTFSAIQPAHFVVDDDYVHRKGEVSHIRQWVDGQLAISKWQLQQLAAGQADNGSAWPELYYFDCNACHHSLYERRVNPTSGVEAGNVRLADPQLHMLGVILKLSDQGTDQQRAKQWRRHHDQLLQAASTDLAALKENAQAALDWLNTEVTTLELPLTATNQLPTLLVRLGRSHPGDFSLASQIAMGLAATYTQNRQSIQALDPLFDLLDNRDAFDPKKYSQLLSNLTPKR